jgi:leucyl-tRNA synthetase
MSEAPQTSRGTYTYRELEARWRQHWLNHKTFKTLGPGDEGYDPEKPKYYVLDMFPYASGTGLHMGHPKGYIASDIYCRYKQMQGFNVLHPMGFDSFGLPAEQFARENNVHPAQATEKIIGVVREQLQILGMAYDWDREIATSRQDYYRWTQWIFQQLFQSWFDPQHEWQDEAGRTVLGKARPVSELCDEFAAGDRSLTDDDLFSVSSDADASSTATWNSLDAAQRAAVLNNYRIAYQKQVTVNWCPGLGTVLANEEVTNEGKSERGDLPVYKRPLKQWVMRITAYADRLLEDLVAVGMPDGRGGTYELDWPEAIKLMQRNWIGRSAGAEVLFDVPEPGSDHDEVLTRLNVFTTRPDTLFGATFMVVAPEHPLLDENEPEFAVPTSWPDGTKSAWKGDDPSLEIRDAISTYISAAAARTAHQQRTEREKTGVFTGILARNPVSGVMIPIFVADYVSMDYGTGAIMAVPAHDERDHEFAQKYDLDIAQVVSPRDGAQDGNEEACFTGEGIACNSPQGSDSSPYEINGRATAEAIAHITEALEREEVGRTAVSYKLRDWIFSRQWYWGEPFPLATHPDGYSVSTEVPVILPEMEDFQPKISDDPNHPISPPLSRAGDEWLDVEVDGIVCRRELDVMPQWAGSCWYYLRFIDPHNSETFCAKDAERSFMPVDLYIGGAEHAVLHLLYARFWHKALFDLGHVSTPEPFKKYFNQGMITADAFADSRGRYVDIREVDIREGEPFHSKTDEKLTRFAGKMGKRYKNGLPPEEVGAEYGIDTLRLYEMYMGPLEASAPWSMEGIRGMQRFLHRVWRNFVDRDGSPKVTEDGADNGRGSESEDLRKLLHKTIDKVTADIEELRFNTAIAALIEFNNGLVSQESVPRVIAQDFIRLLAPLAPHLAEELWERWGFGSGDISRQNWPEVDRKVLVEKTCVLPVQVNGKVRASVEVPVEISDVELRPIVLDLENVRRHLPESGEIKRFILVPGKIVNIVA